jgi:hypothetical protein
LNRRRISQQGLRDIGMHEVPVRLGTEVSPVLNIRIVAEDQRLIFEQQRIAVEEGLLPEIQYDEKGNVRVIDVNKLRRQAAEAAAIAEAAAATAAEAAAIAEAAPATEEA